MTFMLLAALHYFDEAEVLRSSGKNASTLLEEGLKYLGYALHPVQDYFAHTDNRVYDMNVQISNEYYTISSLFPFVIYHPPTYKIIKSHITFMDSTDNAIKRWGQLQQTEAITLGILKTIYGTYPILFGS